METDEPKGNISANRIYHSPNYECIMCGEFLGHDGQFCSDECAEDYNWENRTCNICGGEFWDGGTSCTCKDDE